MIDKQTLLDALDFRTFYKEFIPSIRDNGKPQAKGLCPFHDDRHPSFSVNFETGLWNCLAGCGGGIVFDFYMKLKGVDFQTALEEIAKMTGSTFSDFHPYIGNAKLQSSNKPVETYDYHDIDGNLVFQVCRYEPKSFCQRRSDGNDGWIYDLKGIVPVPYNLPEVIKADMVYICEGEKDCGNLKTIGVVATTSPMGAGKWRKEYSQYLEGKDVVIIPDNDLTGKKHANKVAASLIGIARSVKIVELPGLPDKGDVSDWLDNRDAKVTEDIIEELENIVAYAPEWQKPSPFISSVDLVADPDKEPIEWIVEGVIARKSVNLLVGIPGCLKTWIALYLGRRVSAGDDFCGRHTMMTPVFYIDRENPQGVIIQRLDLIGRNNDFIFWGLWSTPEPPPLGHADYLNIAEKEPLIIFDSLLKFHSGEENSAKDMAQVSKKLAQLRDAGATVIILHHKGKSALTAYRGSSEIIGGVDAAYSLSKDKEGKLLSFKGIKNRFIPEPSLTLEVMSNETSLVFKDVSREKERVKEFEQRERMLELQGIISTLSEDCGESPNQSQILEKAKEASNLGGQHTILDLLEKGEGRYWNVEPGNRGAKLYLVDN